MTTRIRVNNNGSLRVEVDNPEELEITDAQGNKFGLGGRTTVGLCRCGASENKPFCDGKHKACGFQSEVTAVDLPPRTS